MNKVASMDLHVGISRGGKSVADLSTQAGVWVREFRSHDNQRTPE